MHYDSLLWMVHVVRMPMVLLRKYTSALNGALWANVSLTFCDVPSRTETLSRGLVMNCRHWGGRHGGEWRQLFRRLRQRHEWPSYEHELNKKLFQQWSRMCYVVVKSQVCYALREFWAPFRSKPVVEHDNQANFLSFTRYRKSLTSIECHCHIHNF